VTREFRAQATDKALRQAGGVRVSIAAVAREITEHGQGGRASSLQRPDQPAQSWQRGGEAGAAGEALVFGVHRGGVRLALGECFNLRKIVTVLFTGYKLRRMGKIAGGTHAAEIPPDEKAAKPRSGAIDLLRVLGIAAVVIGHVYYNPTVEKALYTWHVPVFFFLTGYLWSPGRTLRTEVSNRVRTIAVPYLSWLAIILAAYVVFALTTGQIGPGTIMRPIYGGYFAVRPFSAFWFMTVLFFLAIFYRLIERLPILAQMAFVLAGLTAGFIFGEYLAMTPLSIGSAWPCLAFVIAGRAFRFWDLRMRHHLLVGLGLIATSVALIVTNVSAPLNIKAGDYGTPVLSVLVACALSGGGIVVARAVLAHLPARITEIVTRLALAGFVVVLSHAIVLWILGTTSAGGVLDLVLTLVLPWLLGLATVSTPLAPWLAGVTRK
jgi:acyltransferase